MVDVERCLLSYGYGYENSLRHIHDGYRLTLHRVFVMGSVELMVVGVHDDDSEEQSGGDRHHVMLQYTQRPRLRSCAGQCDGRAEYARIDTSGATLGTHAETCTLLLADSAACCHTTQPSPTTTGASTSPSHCRHSHSRRSSLASNDTASASTTSSSPSSSPTSCGVWSRLSLKGEESVPHVLCSGDLLRAGFTELQVDIRAIPHQSNAGGYGFGTSGPLPSTLPSDSPCEYDVGVALDGNFLTHEGDARQGGGGGRAGAGAEWLVRRRVRWSPGASGG